MILYHLLFSSNWLLSYIEPNVPEEMFGLNDYTGIEIEESKPIMGSLEVKRQSIENYYENSTESQKKWSDGDSIRCAIGQSYNVYSVMNIAKYSILSNSYRRFES